MLVSVQQQTTIQAEEPSGSQAWDQDLAALIQRISDEDQLAFDALYNATHTLVYSLSTRTEVLNHFLGNVP